MNTKELIYKLVDHYQQVKVSTITQELDASLSRVTYHLKNLKHEGRIHIGAWKVDNMGAPRAVWTIGAGTDATRPIAKPTRHKRSGISSIIKIQPDQAASWLIQQPYPVVRKYVRHQRNGELGVKPSTLPKSKPKKVVQPTSNVSENAEATQPPMPYGRASLLRGNYRSPKLLKYAQEASECMHCGKYNDGSVVAAHSNQLRDGKGKGIKAHDFRIAYLCGSCHHELDQGKDMSRAERVEMWEEAHRKTIEWLFYTGKIVCR
jgi:hypothetical protein